MGGNVASAPHLGTRYPYDCPVCGGGNGNATFKVSRYGIAEWFIGCFSASCEERRGAYLGDLGECFGLGRGATKEQLASHIRGLSRRGSLREPEPLPPPARIDGQHHALLANQPVLDWLRKERGIRLNVVRDEKLGWDGNQITFPMYESGRLVALKRREPRERRPGEPQLMRSIAGRDRPWPLYPAPPPRARWVLLVAGELDALRGRSATLPAVSVTLGVSRWRDAWTEQLRHYREVVVLFDNNEVDQAVSRVGALRDAGINARRLDLRALGLRRPKGDLSDFLSAGGDPRRIHPVRVVRRRSRG